MWQTGLYGCLSDYLLWVILTASLVLNVVGFFRLWPAQRRPRLRLVAGNTVIAIALVAVVALGMETYLRFVSVATDTLGATMTCHRWRAAYASLNSLYCRDKEWTEHKPEGVYRIAFLGDSFTYGWGIDDPRDRFSDIIQQRLDQAGRRVEVMNVAWAAWDTRDQVNMLRDHLGPYAIDEVVLCHLPNDIEKLVTAEPGLDPRVAPTTWYVNVRSSFLVDWVYHRVVAPRILAKVNYLDWLTHAYGDPTVWNQQTAAFEQLARLCRERGIRLRVALLPLLIRPDERFDAAAIHAKVAAAFAEQAIPVLDVLPTLPADPASLVLSRHDAHPNVAAHRLFADVIWKAFYATSEPPG